MSADAGLLDIYCYYCTPFLSPLAAEPIRAGRAGSHPPTFWAHGKHPTTFLPPNWFFFHNILNTCRQWMQISLSFLKPLQNSIFSQEVPSASAGKALRLYFHQGALPLDPLGARPQLQTSHSCFSTLNDLPLPMSVTLWVRVRTRVMIKHQYYFQLPGPSSSPYTCYLKPTGKLYPDLWPTYSSQTEILPPIATAKHAAMHVGLA